MKKVLKTILPIFTFFLVSSCYGQITYVFNKVAINSFSTKSFPNQKMTNLFNTKDETYHMQIYSRNDSLVSRIFDAESYQVHYFIIENSEVLKMKYLRTQTSGNSVKDYKFQLSRIENKKDSSQMKLKILNHRNNSIARYKLKIKETEKNLFFIFKLSALDMRLDTDFIPSKNFIILEAKGLNTNRKHVEYKLESFEDINFKVEIPG